MVKCKKPGIKATAALMFVLFLVSAFIYAFRPGGEFGLTAAGDIIYFSYSLIAAVIGFHAFRFYKWGSVQGKVIFLLSAGIFLNFVAGAILAYYEVVMMLPYPYPSPADYVWVSAYVPIIAGLFYGIKKFREALSLKKVLYSVIPWLVLIILTAVYLLVPILADTEAPAIEKAFNFTYPFADLLVVLGVSMLVVAVLGGRLSTSWVFILIGTTCLYIGDIGFSYLSWTGSYQTGSFTDLFWWGGSLLIAFGFYHTRELSKLEISGPKRSN